MKFLLLALILLPTLSFASLYNCEGSGFSINITQAPLSMKISGNGINSNAQNIIITTTFDTVISGNSIKPAATFKLKIKDSSFGNPGDVFKTTLQISSANGIQEYQNLNCTKGND